MPRRISLPGADELFRSTGEGLDEPRVVPVPVPVPEPAPEPAVPVAVEAPEAPDPAVRAVNGHRRATGEAKERRSSGRIKHDEKMTVYVTAEELIDLEHARLTLRRDAGLAVDRGRLVREAIAIALADIEAKGSESEIARRLSGA